MGKPYKFASQITGAPRGTDGKFVSPVAPLPGEVVNKFSGETGATNNDAIRATRVPDRTVGDGKAKNVASEKSPAPTLVYPESLPWPASGPINDGDHTPFKNLK